MMLFLLYCCLNFSLLLLAMSQSFPEPLDPTFLHNDTLQCANSYLQPGVEFSTTTELRPFSISRSPVVNSTPTPAVKKNRVRYGDMAAMSFNFFISSSGWDVMFTALLSYYEQFGTCNVPRRYQCLLPEGRIRIHLRHNFETLQGLCLRTTSPS